MKRSIIFIIAIVTALACSVGAYAAEPNIQDGLWEITSKTEMKGIPAQFPPVVMKQCLTKQDKVPQAKDASSNCKMTDQKISGNTVTWTMVCKEQGSTTESKGRIAYKGNSFDGVTNTIIKDKSGNTQEMITKMSGKRLGPCTPAKK